MTLQSLEEAAYQAKMALAVLEDASNGVARVVSMGAKARDARAAALCAYACEADLAHALLQLEAIAVLLQGVAEAA